MYEQSGALPTTLENVSLSLPPMAFQGSSVYDG
jgi:hypothetical protein